MKITSKKYPSAKGEITVYRLENESGAWVELSTLGAGIAGVAVPDKDGKIDEVALAYADPADYIADGPCLGKCPGRYANRIAKGHLEVDGTLYQLAINNGPNALHGGPEGFQNQIWQARELPDGIEFSYHAKDGEENYPGNLDLTATYTWSDDNVLTLKFHATSDRDTVINMTNHAYWNLDGADAGFVGEQEMLIEADTFLPTDDTQIPTSEFAPVDGTPMDFKVFKKIGRDLKADYEPLHIGKGYDHCWVIRGWEPGKMIEDAVVLKSDRSGRTLRVSSDQPGVQIYTGNWLAGSPKNKSGRSYEDYDGVAIEMQGFPDAPNKPAFPSQSLVPGQAYDRTIIFAFEAK